MSPHDYADLLIVLHIASISILSLALLAYLILRLRHRENVLFHRVSLRLAVAASVCMLLSSIVQLIIGRFAYLPCQIAYAVNVYFQLMALFFLVSIAINIQLLFIHQMELNNFESFYYVVIGIFATSLAVIAYFAGVYPKERPCGFSSDRMQGRSDALRWAQQVLLKFLVYELWVALTVSYSALVLLISLIRAVHLDHLNGQSQIQHQQMQPSTSAAKEVASPLPPEFPSVDMEYAPKEILYQVRVRRQQRTIVRTTRRVLAYLLVPIFGHVLQVVVFGLQLQRMSPPSASDLLPRMSAAFAASQPILMAICLIADPVIWPLFSDMIGFKSRRRLVAQNGKFLGLKAPISVVGRTFAEEEEEVKYSLQSF